ncbi:MAG TPA: GNAT family N-acetyltransferase [Acidimicrobiales bacterium]|nr:GNAT family N-acetyltransferase [Acidimicrobiales bacterium]
MTSPDVVRLGAERIRVGPWRSTDGWGLVAPVGANRPPSMAAVDRALDELRARGYHRAVTPALAVTEQATFLRRGFEVHHRLHLLTHDLRELPDVEPVPTRRARRSDRGDVIAVDQLAFPPFWRFDSAGLDEALAATPSHRHRVAGDPVHGYSVWGRAHQRGYLQRLAVHPDHAGRGIGAGMVLDGLRWLRRWRVTEALVNTQDDNDRALGLYERLGFQRRIRGLAVLYFDLTDR